MHAVTITSFGYLVYPPVWLGESPLEGTPESLRSTWDIVVRRRLASGIEATCVRNGLFMFDLTEWPLGAAAYGQHHEVIQERVRWRSALMNAHSACLGTAYKRTDETTRDPTVVIPAQLIQGQDNGAMSVTGAPEIGELLRTSWTSLDPPPRDDWRYQRGEVISEAAVEESLALLDGLLAQPDGQRLTLADLLLRGLSAHHNQNYDAAVIQGWAITEKLLTNLWETYIEDNREREIDGRVVPFLNSERKSFLTGRDLSISVVSECLSVLDRLPLDLFQRVRPVRKARNDWMHSLAPVTVVQAAEATSLARDLLHFVHGIDLDPAPDVMIVSGV